VLQLIRAKQFNVQSTQGYKNWATCLLLCAKYTRLQKLGHMLTILVAKCLYACKYRSWFSLLNHCLL